MAGRPPHPCIQPGCTRYTTQTRCPKHQLRYPPAERARMRAAVQAHVATHGWTCPGWGTPPHPSRDLTADHVTPRSRNGNGTALRVLCRACNSRRGTRDD